MFFTIDHNTFCTRGHAWIHEFILGKKYIAHDRNCAICGKEWREDSENYIDKPLDAQVERNTGNKWPDIIGTGHYVNSKIVSQRVLEIWESEGIGSIPSFPVRIIPPFPKKMTTEPPMYYRLDHSKLIGIELDWEASGFCDAKICNICGNLSWNENKSYEMARKQIVPLALKEGSWNGTDIFCSKYVGHMFCTEKVIDCATKHKLTNFRFVPCEIAGNAAFFKGIDYSIKNWRVKMQKQVEQYCNNFKPWEPINRD
jgi:hypothetical protein